MKIKFEAVLEKYQQKGEKTSWTYIPIDAEQANQLKKGYKKAFRVKGTIDAVAIKQIALWPLGEQEFILPLNATIRKLLAKKVGDKVHVEIEEDAAEKIIHPDLLACIELDSAAKDYFFSLTKSHQHYFSNWIESAKTAAIKEKRLYTIMESLIKKWDYPTMIKFYKKD